MTLNFVIEANMSKKPCAKLCFKKTVLELSNIQRRLRQVSIIKS